MRAELLGLDVGAAVSGREWAEEWSDRLEDLLLEVGDLFCRADLRRRAQACVRGLPGPVSRKNAWQLSEYGREVSPWGQQHLLDRSCWDADAVRDFTRR